MTLYFDTSALVKLVVIEDGSNLAAELWASRHPVASSVLSYPEGRAALAAGRRAGRLTGSQYTRALQDFEAAHGELFLLAVDEPLARSAGELAENVGLRGYDAVHLASTLALGADTILITWDRDLSLGAMGLGCAVAPAP